MNISSTLAVQHKPAKKESLSVAKPSKTVDTTVTPSDLDKIVDHLESRDPIYSVYRDIEPEKLNRWAQRVTGNSEKDKVLEKEIAENILKQLSKNSAQKNESTSSYLKERALDACAAAIPLGLTAGTCAIPVIGPATAVSLTGVLASKVVSHSSLPSAVKTVSNVGIAAAALCGAGMAALASMNTDIALAVCAASAGLSVLTTCGAVMADKAGLIDL